MARVRVFLCTHRRPKLLRRALQSLQAQTFADWTCELHNDAPDDAAPRDILDELAANDPRFLYRPHERNWGPVATFNQVFAGGPEPLASLLEDDNWWEPEFLATAVDALERRPEAALAWANMRTWTEEPGGEWRATGRTIWDAGGQSPRTLEFRWPELLQAFDALHSNGAMVFRPQRFRTPRVPASTPFAIIEQMRERAADGPLLFIPKPLGNFAHTRHTARDGDAARWLQAKLLLAASFFGHVPVTDEALRRMWDVRRGLRPRDTGIFFCLAWLLRDRRFVRHAGWRDWAHFLLGSARRPARLRAGLRCRQALPEVWAWLEQQSAGAHRAAAATVLVKDAQQRANATAG